MTDYSLQDKIAIVTGAGSPIGIGRSITLALVRAGARVAIMDINNSWLEQTTKDIREASGDDCVLPIVADVTDPDAVDRAVSTTISDLGGLHILVNNAGTNPRAAGLLPGDLASFSNFWDITPEAWMRVVAVNFSGPFLMSRAVVGHMMAQRWGRIIGVTTSMDTMIRERGAPYGPSKAGHEALVAMMARELEGTGVTANVLVPGGATNTNLIAPDTQRDRSELIQPEVMQSPVVWLASDESNEFNSMRVIAQHWDEALPISKRLERAGAPAAWPQLAPVR